MTMMIITAQPCCSQLSRMQTFTCHQSPSPLNQPQEGRRRLQELMSERATGLESRRRQQVDQMGNSSGEAGNRWRLLELKASNRHRQLPGGVVDCERSSEERLQEDDVAGAGAGAGAGEGAGGMRAKSELGRLQDKHRARSASVSTPPHTKPLAARTSSFSPGSLAVGPPYQKTRLSNFSFRSRASSVSSGSSTPSSSASSSPSSESSSTFPPCSTEQFWNQYRRRPPTTSMTKMLKKALTSRLPSRERRAESRESRGGSRSRGSHSVDRVVPDNCQREAATRVGREQVKRAVREEVKPRGRRVPRLEGGYPPSGVGLL